MEYDIYSFVNVSILNTVLADTILSDKFSTVKLL